MSRPCTAFLSESQEAYSLTSPSLVTSHRQSVPLPELGRQEVHVWYSVFSDIAPCFRPLLSALADNEVEKANRFRFQKDRERYVLARGLLRQILSSYTGVHTRSLQFGYGPHGKPFLISESGEEAISFNLSHAVGAVVYVLTRGRPVGVDLEYLSGHADHLELSKACLSPREARWLQPAESSSDRKLVLTFWTRKEAYAKATGQGLSLDFHSFDVVVQGDSRPRLQFENPTVAERWSLMDLAAPRGYVAALAVEGKISRLVCRRYMPNCLKERQLLPPEEIEESPASGEFVGD